MPRPRAPFRLRPSRRTILLACILLLAGAIVNVAVAWVLVGAPDSWTPGGPSMWYARPGDGDWDERHVARLRTGHTFVEGDAGVFQRGLGWTVVSVFSNDGWSWEGVQGGWPARSLMVVKTTKASTTGKVYADSIVYSPAMKPPQRFVPGPAWFADDRDRLPLKPLTAGFAINTLFYTAILALPLSFFPIRRRVRARRGRCPACGYDLTGAPAPGGGGVCPECGAGRRNTATSG